LKRAILILAALLFLGVSIGAFAVESEYYARTVYIEKVFPHRLGYKIYYTNSKLDLVEVYLPHSWFLQSSSTSKGEMAKGELVTGNDSSYPYMIVFWKAGKFSHVRLFLKRDMNDISYGTLSGENIDDKFNVQDIPLEF